MSALKAGTLIGQYQVIEELGSGGMGAVYLCLDELLNRQVAVKVIPLNEFSSSDAISRFLQEGKALARLQHPQIVSVYSLGQTEGFAYLAMEFVEGATLHTLSRRRLVSVSDALRIFIDVAEGLHHVHKAGIIHRDLKPGNIMVGKDARAKLIDFGIAKLGEGDEDGGVKTQTGIVIGTLNYIAPELFRGEAPSVKSDLYSLGLILYESLTGRTPFKGQNRFETMEKIRSGELEIAPVLKALVPAEVWNLVEICVRPDPQDRPRDCMQIIEQTRDALKRVEPILVQQGIDIELAKLKIENWQEASEKLRSLGVKSDEMPLVFAAALCDQPSTDSTSKINIERLSSSVVRVQEVARSGAHRISGPHGAARLTRGTSQFATLQSAQSKSANRAPVLEKPVAKVSSTPKTIQAVALIGFSVVVLLMSLGWFFNMFERPSEVHTNQVRNPISRPELGSGHVSPRGDPEAGQAIAANEPRAPSSALPPLGVLDQGVVDPNGLHIPPPNLRIGTQVFQITRSFRSADRSRDRAAKSWELWTLLKFEGGLHKWKIETKNEANTESLDEARYWWTEASPIFLAPRHSFMCPIHGDSTNTYSMPLSEIFPLQVGRRIRFSTTIVNSMSPKGRTMVRECEVGAPMKTTTAIGENQVVPIFCRTMRANGPPMLVKIHYSGVHGMHLLVERSGADSQASGAYGAEVEVLWVNHGSGQSFSEYLSAPTGESIQLTAE